MRKSDVTLPQKQRMTNWASVTYKCVGRKEETDRLYNLVLNLNGSLAEVGCRGQILDVYMGSEPSSLTIDMWCAWDEPVDFRKLIEKKFPSIKVYYIVEEPGCEIWQTNDKEGIFFPDRYFLDFEDGGEYFKTLGDAASFTSKKIGMEVHTVDEIDEALDSYMEAHPDAWFSFHEFEILDD